MLSCRFLCQVSKTLCTAKDNSLPFENVNILFAENFAQLPPMIEKCLYSYINIKNYSKTSSGHDIMFRKTLQSTVKTVVILEQ